MGSKFSHHVPASLTTLASEPGLVVENAAKAARTEDVRRSQDDEQARGRRRSAYGTLQTDQKWEQPPRDEARSARDSCKQASLIPRPACVAEVPHRALCQRCW